MTLPLPVMLVPLSKYQIVPKSNNNRTERVRKISIYQWWYWTFIEVLVENLILQKNSASLKTLFQNCHWIDYEDNFSKCPGVAWSSFWIEQDNFDYSMRLTLYQFESKTQKWCVVPFLIWVVCWWLIAMIWRWMFAMGCYYDLVIFGYVFFLEVGGNPHQWTIGLGPIPTGPIPRSCFRLVYMWLFRLFSCVCVCVLWKALFN